MNATTLVASESLAVYALSLGSVESFYTFNNTSCCLSLTLFLFKSLILYILDTQLR